MIGRSEARPFPWFCTHRTPRISWQKGVVVLSLGRRCSGIAGLNSPRSLKVLNYLNNFIHTFIEYSSITLENKADKKALSKLPTCFLLYNYILCSYYWAVFWVHIIQVTSSNTYSLINLLYGIIAKSSIYLTRHDLLFRFFGRYPIQNYLCMEIRIYIWILVSDLQYFFSIIASPTPFGYKLL